MEAYGVKWECSCTAEPLRRFIRGGGAVPAEVTEASVLAALQLSLNIIPPNGVF